MKRDFITIRQLVICITPNMRPLMSYEIHATLYGVNTV